MIDYQFNYGFACGAIYTLVISYIVQRWRDYHA